MKLYPEDAPSGSIYGKQQFADPNYEPIALDSAAAAKARMLAKLEADCSKEEAIAEGLKGSDEVGTVEKILAGILGERSKLLNLDRTAKTYAADVASNCTDLDKAKWLAARPAKDAVVEAVK